MFAFVSNEGKTHGVQSVLSFSIILIKLKEKHFSYILHPIINSNGEITLEHSPTTMESRSDDL